MLPSILRALVIIDNDILLAYFLTEGVVEQKLGVGPSRDHALVGIEACLTGVDNHFAFIVLFGALLVVGVHDEEHLT